MFCPSCGAANADAASFCAKCGKSLSGASDQARWAPSQAARNADEVSAAGGGVVYVQYGGFWRRFAAYIIDYILLSVVQTIFSFVFGVGIAASFMSGNPAAAIGSTMLFVVVSMVGAWLYYALMESSSLQATLGKMALGMRVTDLYGNRIGFGRATGRLFAKIISSIVLCIGYIMAGFTERKQALHDMIAGTLVVVGNPVAASQSLAGGGAAPGVAGAAPGAAGAVLPMPPGQARGMPGWAIALIVVAVLVFPAGIIAAISIPAYQQYTVRAQVVEGLNLAAPLKAQVAETIAGSTQPVPEVMASIKLPEQSSHYVQSIDIREGALVITYGNQANALIRGETLALAPERGADGAVLWLCGYQAPAGNGEADSANQEALTTVPSQYLPSSCRSL